ncbi:M20 metallopeptidase family protein [Deminuibacter soli]|nr:M20 family metallopeptidase [Deminuibacter soli]
MEEQLFDKLVAIRRRLHQFPELSFTEFKTSALVAAELRGLDIPVITVAQTGLIGTLQKGEGPTVLLRADMDALPVQEDSGVSFPSLTEGAMHACGHDLHVAMLLGAAHLLKQQDFTGTVRFVFQPAEESPLRSPEPGKSGGQLMMESGELAGADAVLGLHVNPLLPTGQLEYKTGEALACVGNFVIRIHGKGGHPGAMKHVIDPVAVAGALIPAAHALVGVQPDPPIAVLAITHVETLAKPSFNVVPNSMLLQGSLRAVQIADYQSIVARLRTLLQQLEERYNCRIELEFTAYYPGLLNDAGIHDLLSPVRKRLFGEENMVAGQDYLVGEDFSFYSRAMPGQFYFLGAQTEENHTYWLHHPKVTFNEDCIKYGAPFLAEGALQLLQTLKPGEQVNKPGIGFTAVAAQG